MHIQGITFENFRGFAQCQLAARGRMTIVLAGPNGCGKSSALDAAASLLSAIPSILNGHPAIAFGVGDEGNIRAGQDFSRWGIEVTDTQRFEHWGAIVGRPPVSKVVPPKAGFSFIDEWAGRLGTEGGPPDTLPVVTHLHSGSTKAPRPYVTDEDGLVGRLAAYRGAFDQEASHFEALEHWFASHENLENQEKVAKGNLAFQLKPLKAVRAALKTFLQALRADRLGEIRVIRSLQDGPLGDVTGRLTVQKDGEALFIDQLSDGERRLVLLVGDVARRMAILNPHLDDPTQSPGIVMADEVDLHLHPGWQRRVMPALRAAFPKVQLIVTTHSPQVLASVPSESVVLMKDFEFLPGHPRVQGRDTNTLLESVFEVPSRPEEVRLELEALYDALDDHPEQARALFSKLQQTLEGNDPELARIETLLDLAGA